MLYIQYPTGCTNSLIKYIKLIVTLSHINTKYLKYNNNSNTNTNIDTNTNSCANNSINYIKEYDIICNLASQYFIYILQHVNNTSNSINNSNSNDNKQIYINGWVDLITTYHITLEEASVLQFIEIDQNTPNPLITEYNSSTRYNLGLIGLSYIVSRYIRCTDGDRNSGNRGNNNNTVSTTNGNTTAMEVLFIQDHFRMFRSVWHWMMIESITNTTNTTNTTNPTNMNNTYDQNIYDLKILEHYAIECVAHVSNYKPIKQYMMKFGAIDK